LRQKMIERARDLQAVKPPPAAGRPSGALDPVSGPAH
jgi:hypothetical protein